MPKFDIIAFQNEILEMVDGDRAVTNQCFRYTGLCKVARRLEDWKIKLFCLFLGLLFCYVKCDMQSWIDGYKQGHNHTDGSELTPLCHDWCVSCPKPITTHRCESLPPSVVTPYQVTSKGHRIAWRRKKPVNTFYNIVDFLRCFCSRNSMCHEDQK